MLEIAKPTNWAELGFLLASVPVALLLYPLAQLICRHTGFCLQPDVKPTTHQHVCDMDRSQVTIDDNGALRLRCSISGCEVTMVMGHDIAHCYPLREVEAYR